MMNQTVAVSLPELDRSNNRHLESMEKFVRCYQGPKTKLLAPGTYSRLQASVVEKAKAVLELAQGAGFETVTTRLQALHKALLFNTYVVALTGPARAGKSTLLNTLLGLEVSPMGQLPTTAVSLLVVGAEAAAAEIFMEDGTKEVGPATADYIEQFATQENNPDNHKKVQRVVIHLVNEVLERGIAFADAPGLYDPSESIREVTARALDAAHAILYIIDVSSAQNGGFSLNEHNISDLRRLSKRHDHLFLILNKADVLLPEQRTRTQAYVEKELKKYEVWDKMAQEPFFLSALDAWNWRQSGSKGEGPQKILDDALWTFLLKTNATGTNRLLQSIIELKRAGVDLLSLVNARRLNGMQAQELQISLRKCSARQRELLGLLNARIVQVKDRIQDDLLQGYEDLTTELNTWLSQIHPNVPLPSSAEIQKHIQDELLSRANQTWFELDVGLKQFAAAISIEVEKALQQTRLASGLTENMRILLPSVTAPDLSKTESFEEAWAGMFTAGILGALFSGGFALVLGVAGLLFGLAIGSTARRKRQVARIVRQTNSSLESVYENLWLQMEEKIDLYGKALERQINDRMGLFVSEATRQMQSLGLPIPLSEQLEMTRIEELIQKTVTSMEPFENELRVAGTSDF